MYVAMAIHFSYIDQYVIYSKSAVALKMLRSRVSDKFGHLVIGISMMKEELAYFTIYK